MPGYVATNFVENLLFLLSALEHHGLPYTAHFGSVLGAARLGGVCPWDEDADIYLIDQDRERVERMLREPLERHGFLLIYDARGFFWVRQDPWWAGQGHIGLSFLPLLPAGSPRPTSPVDDRMAWEELYPLCRLPFHGSWYWGPADPERLLERLYGETGSVETMARFRAPTIDAEVSAFWRRAREGELDWSAISARLLERRRTQRFAHVRCFPWWWWNGGYNVGIQKLRRLGGALAERQRARRV